MLNDSAYRISDLDLKLGLFLPSPSRTTKLTEIQNPNLKSNEIYKIFLHIQRNCLNHNYGFIKIALNPTKSSFDNTVKLSSAFEKRHKASHMGRVLACFTIWKRESSRNQQGSDYVVMQGRDLCGDEA
ncbi:unnamed protein product [Vicia faba]|uniref:DDE Tnp4 domain-containing protein n=1 Tax=Vicia faba TaxID=3906 RepID=A0AAV1AJM1_VICFA|nr:unnamed protein product [Vicia faba]